MIASASAFGAFLTDWFHEPGRWVIVATNMVAVAAIVFGLQELGVVIGGALRRHRDVV